jgi:hypothetical protein
VTKIKKDLITKAKVKKQYAKVKAEHQKQATTTEPQDPTTQTAAAAEDGETTNQPAPEPAQLHPERQAMLDSTAHPDANPNDGTEPTSEQQQPRQRRPRKQHQHQQRPDYYTKELAAASHAKQQAEERAAEFARRDQERQQRVAERERYRRAMDKAKTPGRDGKVKVGKESRLLLERVQRMMGGGK